MLTDLLLRVVPGIASSLWFLKTAITDDQRIDAFEGAMVLLMQTLVFITLLSPF